MANDGFGSRLFAWVKIKAVTLVAIALTAVIVASVTTVISVSLTRKLNESPEEPVLLSARKVTTQGQSFYYIQATFSIGVSNLVFCVQGRESLGVLWHTIADGSSGAISCPPLEEVEERRVSNCAIRCTGSIARGASFQLDVFARGTVDSMAIAIDGENIDPHEEVIQHILDISDGVKKNYDHYRCLVDGADFTGFSCK